MTILFKTIPKTITKHNKKKKLRLSFCFAPALHYLCDMIIYFSGTGNTRWAATTLSEKTGEKLIDITDIAGTDVSYKLEEGERLGFCFPVHGWRPPLIVRNFIRRLSIINAEGHYCYVLCTTGDNVGEAVDIFERDLKRIGVHLDSAFSLIMPESYVGLPFMDVDTRDKEKQKKEKATEDLERFTDMIMKRQTGVKDLVIGRWPKINSRLIGSFFVKHLITDKPFHVTEDLCIRCGKCAEACPVNDIIWSKGSMPKWKHNGSCLSCFACYHHCPKHAIEYGGRTKNKGQYFFEKNERR